MNTVKKLNRPIEYDLDPRLIEQASHRGVVYFQGRTADDEAMLMLLTIGAENVEALKKLLRDRLPNLANLGDVT